MGLEKELILLKNMSDLLKFEHHSSGTEIVYSLSDSSISGDDQDEKNGLYHTALSFADFELKRKSGELQHYDLDYIYIKIGKRFRHALEGFDATFPNEFLPYPGYLKMSYFEKYDGKLLARCSDGYAYELPLDTLFYIEQRRIHEDLDLCIKHLLAQQNQRLDN